MAEAWALSVCSSPQDELWEYWGSSADQGWGAGSVETGWYSSRIASILAMRRMGMCLFAAEGLEHLARSYEVLRNEMLQEPRLGSGRPGGLGDTG